jgi:hypothetical protein
LTATIAAAISIAVLGLFPQIRLGDCHAAGGISVKHHDGTYWCVGGFYDSLQIFTF